MTTEPKHSKTRRAALAGLMLAAGIAIGWAAAQWRGHGTTPAVDSAAAPSTERPVLYWYDPMVPTQRFDKPGKSPFMDMQLVPRYADEGASSSPGLAVSPQAQQALGLRLATVERRAVGVALDVVGTVQLNQRDLAVLQARTAGFVERVHGRAPGDVVAAGAPLADVLNPEWLGAQQEYLAVKATGDAALTRAARQRLVLLGLPAATLERVDASGQPVALQTLVAPIGGVITELAVRAGMALSPGMTLARINGLATVWLEAAVPEAQAAVLRPGQPVTASFPALPGQVVKGRVAAVLPEADAGTRTLRVRIELPNPGQRLRAGLFAQVSLQGPPVQALVVPAEAVIRTGRRALVYVSPSPGRFSPVEVQIGEQLGELIVVRQGLAEGQQVVASGQFLIDSEASLQGVMARAAPDAEHRTTGTVVALESGSVTLDHAPVPALNWPAMTMDFKLADPALAKGLKPGDRLQFSFRQQGDDYLLLRAAPAASGASR